MSFTASISMSCGDIIYSLPLLRHIQETTGKLCELLICDTHSRYAKGQTVNTYTALRRLLEKQTYIAGVTRIRESQIGMADYQLDLVRKHPRFRTQPMPISFFEAQSLNAPANHNKPWLSCAVDVEVKKQDLWLVNATNKFNQHGFDWHKYFELQAGNEDGFAFIGLESEYEWFTDLIGKKLTYLPCKDLHDVAININSVDTLLCEQSSPLTIAQGLGVSVQLARDRRFMNVICTKNTYNIF